VRHLQRPEARAARAVLGLLLLAILQPVVSCGVLRAQQEERPEVIRGLELENAGKLKEAAAVFRSALRVAPSANAILGLERVYSDLGMSDSLLAPLDTLIAQNPRESVYRTVQLRTLQMLRRDDRLREAFERWVRAVPRDATPYREYARILIQLGRPATADTVVARGRMALGSLRDLEYENAQLRAAMGEWLASAQSWRRALADAPHLAIASAYALAPAPPASREGIRAALASLPADPGSRRALAELELTWGRPPEAWDALRTLRPDTAAATMWEEFGDRAYTEERWAIAHDALVAALRVRWTSPLAVRAASAALRSGAPAEVFTLAPLERWEKDSARAAREYLPLHVAALVALGRGSDADALVARFDRFLVPAQRMRVAQMVAMAWVRAGDLTKARAALRAAGPDADSSEAAGWLALYDGRLAPARTLLRASRAPNAELALAMGIVARAKGDTAPQLGAAFLAMARSDSAGASVKFVDAAAKHPEVAAPLLLVAARLRAPKPDLAIPIWQRIVAEHASSPEAVESELEWARVLRRRGDVPGATAHLEHLILSAPQSALLPQARRELELVRGTVPPGS
jgi:tetratricopeptide (TPR) repeat protein